MTNNIYKKAAWAIVFSCTLLSCQKIKHPALGDYTKDSNPPGGPLKFYAAFDGTTADPLMNAVDSIRATFPASNPLAAADGVSGKAIIGETGKYLKYVKPNDWATSSKSFTISFWEKRNGQTQNNTGTNGPEYPVSFKSSNGHWSGGSMFVILEGNNAACAVKVMIADANVADNWFTWEGGNTIAGLLDNTWHHIALVYDAGTSGMSLYVDGALNAIVPHWGSHGDINIDNSKITEMRIGAGPADNFTSDDWLSSTWKGSLDQFRMYNVALTGTEVSALFSSKE